MQSSNPVFQRSSGFNGRTAANDTRISYPAYGTPSGTQTSTTPTAPTTVDRGPMTIDSVVQKTGITLGLVAASAAVTWVMTGSPVATDGTENTAAAQQLMTLWMVGAFAGLGLALVLSFRRTISPALVIAYAIVEGVFVGAMSKWFETIYPGVVMGAVIGTAAAVVGTLAAYKFFNIQVGTKFRTFVVAAMFGMVALGLMEMVLGFFGNQIGFFGFGGIGLLFAVGGLVLGVFMLILDFDFVEKGIAAGLPERDSWRAAFGLTVSLVWIYTNLLRILAIFQSD